MVANSDTDGIFDREFFRGQPDRLSNGETIVAGRFPNRDSALNEGRHLAFKLGHDHEWPLVDGRYVRPEAVVSIDVETLER